MNRSYYSTTPASNGTYWQRWSTQRERDEFVRNNPRAHAISAREHNRPSQGAHYRQGK